MGRHWVPVAAAAGTGRRPAPRRPGPTTIAQRVAKYGLAGAETEGEFQRWVIELAERCGWTLVHFQNVELADGWRVPFIGQSGFPDLVLARDGVLLMVELKRMGEDLRDDQELWRRAIGGQHRVWRPSDKPEITRVLTAPRWTA